MHKTKIVCLLSALLCAAVLSATPTEEQKIVETLEHQLSEADSPDDSIPILYNIFDIAKRDQRIALAPVLKEVAIRAGNEPVRMDMLRHMANFYLSNDSMLNILLREALHIPESDEQKETVTFLRMMQATCQAKYSTGEERQKLIREILNNLTNSHDTDIYHQVVMLHTLCTYLGRDTQGDLLTRYLDKQERMINELPGTFPGIKNLLYTQAAELYSNREDHDKAVYFDKKLLTLIDNLIKEYAAKGRIYRNYDTNYYVVYRRLLANHQSLTPQEIETYHNKIIGLCANNQSLAADLQNNERANIYYLMAHKNYKEVLPMLKRQVEREQRNMPLRRTLIKNMIEAAQGCGDSTTLLTAAMEYKKILEEYIESKTFEKYSELQIVYDINDLKSQNAKLELEKRESKIASNRNIIILSLVAIILLVVLVGFIYRLYRKANRLSLHMMETNQTLKDERDAMKETQKALIAARDEAQKANRLKNDFVNNMSHEVKAPLDAIVEYSQLIVDGMDNEKQKYFQRFAQMVTLNSELLHTLVNDVLEISTLENPRMNLTKMPVSLHSICHMAVGSVAIHVPEGVVMQFDQESSPERTIKTDSRRVEQVLINLLNNAVKFTSEGSIILSYTIDNDASTVTFAVTDTGIGIPKGKEEIIFERFEKLDNTTQGSGLGLNICLLIAKLLKGSIRVDTTYRHGARFLFTIPMS